MRKIKRQTISDEVPLQCEGCLRWSMFKRKCRFFWENKPECYSKVTTDEEWKKMAHLRDETFKISKPL